MRALVASAAVIAAFMGWSCIAREAPFPNAALGSTDGGGLSDGGALDGGALDGGALDGGALDGGALDGGALDGGVPDGGVPDGGVPDGGAPDGGAPDGGEPDGGALDDGALDGGTLDSGTRDAGHADGGTLDGGTTDGGHTDGGVLEDGGDAGISFPRLIVSTVSFSLGYPLHMRCETGHGASSANAVAFYVDQDGGTIASAAKTANDAGVAEWEASPRQLWLPSIRARCRDNGAAGRPYSNAIALAADLSRPRPTVSVSTTSARPGDTITICCSVPLEWAGHTMAIFATHGSQFVLTQPRTTDPNGTACADLGIQVGWAPKISATCRDESEPEHPVSEWQDITISP